MPTGVTLRNPRDQLFAAAERILVREGQSALTSRAVTAEAGVAKGVLHRHFRDFDDFLAELVKHRALEAAAEAHRLTDNAGAADVVENLTRSLLALFDPVVREIVCMVIARDGLRQRLRSAGHSGMPVLTEATEAFANYLAAEQSLGRLRREVDPHTLALSLIGSAHLISARVEAAPDLEGLRRMVSSTVKPTLR